MLAFIICGADVYGPFYPQSDAVQGGVDRGGGPRGCVYVNERRFVLYRCKGGGVVRPFCRIRCLPDNCRQDRPLNTFVLIRIIAVGNLLLPSGLTISQTFPNLNVGVIRK